MEQPFIERAKDNKDKQRTYAYWKGRYKLAVREGFYVEAAVIDYALMEDRLASILFYSGVIPNRQTLKMQAKTTKQVLRKILVDSRKYSEPLRVNLMNITGKIQCLQSIVEWVKNGAPGCEENKYLKTLKSQYELCNLDGLEQCFDEILVWCKYRNEIMHSALNKNLDWFLSNFKDKVEEGFRLANYLDAQERMIRKENKIRKAANLPIK